jgi:hypothetical protein
MLFNGIGLNVYEIEELYILATSEEKALEFYAREQNIHLEDIEAIYCDIEVEGIQEDCDLSYAMEFISKLEVDKSITVIKINDEDYSLFTTFKDYIQECVNEDWFKNIENEPYIIAWNE